MFDSSQSENTNLTSTCTPVDRYGSALYILTARSTSSNSQQVQRPSAPGTEEPAMGSVLADILSTVTSMNENLKTMLGIMIL